MDTKPNLKLHLGSGGRNIPTYLNIDIDPNTKPFPPDLVEDCFMVPSFKENTIDEILSVHLIEHAERNKIEIILQRWYNLLKFGGKIYISTPDFKMIAKHYIYHEDLSILLGYLCGGQRSNFDYHKCLFDFTYLKELMEKVGFKEISIYNWKEKDFFYIDDYSKATLPGFNLKDGKLMSLNITGTK